MLQIERHQKIIEYINKAKQVTTDQLAEALNVSKPTIRRDIDVLSRNGLICKVYGGAASLNEASLREIPYSEKATVNASAKQKIGVAAAKTVETGDIIILDSGSTTLEIAKNLTQPNITVLTNDIKIAMELSSRNNIQTIMCGGALQNSVFTLTGNTSVEFFKKVHVNKLFLGCDALDLTFGISDRSAETAAVKQAMIQAADKVIVTTDYSKLDKKVYCYVCGLSEIDLIILDKADDRYLKAFKENVIEAVLTDNKDLQKEVLAMF